MLLIESYWASTRTVQSHPSISFVYYSQNMYMELKLQVSEKQHNFFTLIWPRDKNENSKTLLHIYKIYSIISWSINCLLFEMLMELKWQALNDRKHCSTLIWPKCKFRILTAHLQDMPNHILAYQLSTPENVDVVEVTNLT